MKYIVVAKFKDLEDNNHIYKVGDDYPHEDKDIKDISKERIEQLTTTNNKLNKILIKEDKKEGTETAEVDNVEDKKESTETVEVDNAEDKKEGTETVEVDNAEDKKEGTETAEVDNVEGEKEKTKTFAKGTKNNRTTTKTKK